MVYSKLSPVSPDSDAAGEHWVGTKEPALKTRILAVSTCGGQGVLLPSVLKRLHPLKYKGKNKLLKGLVLQFCQVCVIPSLGYQVGGSY